MKRLCVAGLLICLAGSCCAVQNLASAHDFVSKLYDSYEHPSCPECPKIFGKQAYQILSPSLLRLIRRDEARTQKGYVRTLDFDPICACQDPDGLHVLKLEIRPASPSRASADLLVEYTGNKQQAIRLSLIHTPQGWRVDDVSTKDEASLRKLLNSEKQP